MATTDITWFSLASAIDFGLVALLAIPCLYLLLTPKKSVTNIAVG